MSSSVPVPPDVPADLTELADMLVECDLIVADFVGILARDSFSCFVDRSFSVFCFISSALGEELLVAGMNEELLMIKKVATRQAAISTRRTRPTANSFLTSQNE